MPWTAGGLPVAIDMLFGHVKLGTSPSATPAKPAFVNRATLGTTPSRTPRAKYAGSPPSMHTTTIGRDGHRYRTPFSAMLARAIEVSMCRVGRWRGGVQGVRGQAVSPRFGRVSPSSGPSLRLQHPLIKPDVTISVIRLSDRVHRVASSGPARSCRATDTARPS